MNTALSPQIFSHLFNGALINKHSYDGAILTNNTLYDEIFSNLDAYRQHYALMGYELAMVGDSYFIREQADGDPFKDVSMKVQVLLEVIARHITQVPLHATVLLDVRSGISKEILERIGQDDDVKDILRACEMKASLLQEVTNVLVGRSIAYWNDREALVLTDGGIALFDQLFLDEPGTSGQLGSNS